MKIIKSRSNPSINLTASLQHKKYRLQHQLFIAEGSRACSTLIRSGHLPRELFTTDNQLLQAQSLVSDQHITLVTEPIMAKLSAAEAPSGLLGVFSIPRQSDINRLTSGLVLVNLSDPGNIGTLIRSAAALNVQSVVLIDGADPWSPKIVQASAGTIGMISLFQLDWNQLMSSKGNKKLYALVATGGKLPTRIPHNNFLILIGSEAHGIPQKWLADCDERITIPMPGDIESLNAAVAGSIALYLATQYSV